MKLERYLRSALRLPRRLAHALHVALQIVGWALTLQLRAGLRRRRHARLIRRSSLFDVPFYLSQCGGEPAARRDPFTHYLVRGAALGLSPHPLFDGAAYLARNPEAAGENPLVHHLLARRARAAERRPPPAASAPAPGLGEALLLAHPFAAPEEGGARRVLVVDADPPQEGSALARAAELVRLAGEVGPVTLVSAAAPPAGGGAEVLPDFPAAVAHLATHGQRYAVVLVRGLEQASRFLAPVRAYAAQAALVCDAAGSLPRAARPVDGGPLRRERSARVAAACADVIVVDTPAERDAVLRLAAGARVEVVPRGEEGLAGVLARSRSSLRAAGGAA